MQCEEVDGATQYIREGFGGSDDEERSVDLHFSERKGFVAFVAEQVRPEIIPRGIIADGETHANLLRAHVEVVLDAFEVLDGRKEHDEGGELTKSIGVGDEADGTKPVDQKRYPRVVLLILDAFELRIEDEVADDVEGEESHPFANIEGVVLFSLSLKHFKEVVYVRCQCRFLITDSSLREAMGKSGALAL
jgi:hypothetical protein